MRLWFYFSRKLFELLVNKTVCLKVFERLLEYYIHKPNTFINLKMVRNCYLNLRRHSIRFHFDALEGFHEAFTRAISLATN